MSNMLLDLDPAGAAEQNQKIELNTRDAAPDPGILQNFGKGVGMRTMRGLANTARTAATIGAVVPMAHDWLTDKDPRHNQGESSADQYFKKVDEYANNAVDYWTPKAGEVGKAGEIVGGLAEGLIPLALGPAGVPAMLGNAQVGTSMDLMRDQKVDADTALKVGLLAGVSNAVGFKIPFLGSTLSSRVASGVAGNVATGMATRAAQAITLRDAGYTEASKQFDAMHAETVALDAIMGAAFGGIAHATSAKVLPSQGDAALMLRNAKHFQEDSAPGLPMNLESSAAHQQAMETAMSQLIKGEPVNVVDAIKDAEFLKPPELMREPPLAAAIREMRNEPVASPSKPEVLNKVVDRIIGLESGGKADAKNPNSTATGAGQFIKSTWLEMMKQNRPDLTQGKKDDAILAMRSDPVLSREMVTRYAESNGKALEAAGLPADAQNLYLAHHMGADGAIKMLQADPATHVKDLVTPAQYAANPHFKGKTVDDLLASFARRSKIDTDTTLAPEQRKIEQDFAHRVAFNYNDLIQQYASLKDTMGGKLLNTDTARELSPDYLANRNESAAVHEPASFFTKELYADALKAMPEGSSVVFTAGGTGAGKTTTMQTHELGRSLMDKAGVIYDTNMNGLESSIKKVDQALDAGHAVRVVYVARDPVDALVNGALPRAMHQEAEFGSGRTVPLKEHLATHAGVENVMRELQARYQDNPLFRMYILDNSYGKGQSKLVETLDKLPKRDYTQTERELRDALDKERASGKIGERVYQATLAQGVRERPSVQNDGGAPLLERGARSSASPSSQRGSDTQARSGTTSPLTGEIARQALDPQAFPVRGKESSVVTERGAVIPTQYVAVEASSLITSHDNVLKPNPAFPAELQPRDRARAASEAQITQIENKLNPELLAESVKASDGAPIIGKDGVVESGNARTIGLRRAYESGKAEQYRAWLNDNSQRFGLDRKQVMSMKQPVLVRVGTGEYNRAEFARQANESTVAQMSAPEMAKSDAQHMPNLQGLVTHDDGTINQAQSANFIRGFIERAVSPSERGQMMTKDGQLSQQGMQRLRNAVFERAYGDTELTSMMAESTDVNVRNILAGMLRAAPSVARLRDLIEAGARRPIDISSDLVQAVHTFSQLRAEGKTLAQYLRQDSLIDVPISPEVHNLLVGLGENAKSSKRVGEMISRMVDSVDRLGDPRQAGIFNEMGDVKAHDLFADTVESLRADTPLEMPKIPEADVLQKLVEQNPDALILTGYDASGAPIHQSLREALADAQADHTIQVHEAQAYDAAINCFLRKGS